MADDILHLWLHGEHLGEIQRLRSGRNRLRFDPEALSTWGAGTRLLSYSIPLTAKRVESLALDVYLDNLLPEGSVRAQVEREYAVRPGDAFGLLRHLGAECAGAVQLTPTDTVPAGHLRALSEPEVDRIVADLPTLSPPEGEGITASLGGVQSKVLLTKTSDGWSWPASGAMSSHIIKPEPVTPDTPIPQIIEYEHWAMGLAALSGIPAATCGLERFGDRLALVVERYDRQDGRRLHQEDFAQALSVRPGDKYEPANSEGRLRQIARGAGAEAISPSAFRRDLLRLVTFNVIVGNGDGHAKNYSLILSRGTFPVAPAYDVAPVYYANNRFRDFGMRVDGQRGLPHITCAHLVSEARSWGMQADEATDVIAAVATRVQQAVAEPGPAIGEQFIDRVVARAADLHP